MKRQKLLLIILAVILVISTVACSNGKIDGNTQTGDSKEEPKDSIRSFESVLEDGSLGGALEYFDETKESMTDSEKKDFAENAVAEVLGRLELYRPLSYIERINKEYPFSMEYAGFLYEGVYNPERNTVNYAPYLDNEYMTESFKRIENDDVFVLAKSYFFENDIYDDGFVITVRPEYLDKLVSCFDLAFKKNENGYYYYGEGEPVYGLEEMVFADRVISGDDQNWETDDTYGTVYLENVNNLDALAGAWKTTVLLPVEIVYDESAGIISYNDVDGDKYLANYEHFIDLDSDGNDEIVTFNTFSMGFMGNALSINDEWVYFDDLGLLGELMDNGFKIVDIDENDNRKEILVESAMPPYEVEFSIFAYYPDNAQGEKIQLITSIDTDGYELEFEGNKQFFTYMDSVFVDAAMMKIVYSLDSEENVIRDLDMEGILEYVDPVHTLANEDMEVYLESDLSSESRIIKNGEGFIIYYETDDGWLNISTENDEEERFWMNTENLDHYNIKPFEAVKFWS